jgi:RNA polymerase sigma-70 factor, ECF subfamily
MAASRSSAARAAADRSFEELYRGHRGDVFRVALRELGNVHDAEDVTQAAFADAYRAVLRGSQPQSPRAWLLAIAENVRRRRYRTSLRRPREEPTDADFPLSADLPHELAHALAAALADLPHDQRRAFVLRELAGLSYEEIATATDSTVGAIQMQLFRARRSLRERLEPPTTRRRTGLLALPGWATTLLSRADATLLAPRAAGALGAAAAAVVAASTVAVGEAPSQTPPPAPERPTAVVRAAPAAVPVARPAPGPPASRATRPVREVRARTAPAARPADDAPLATPAPAPASAPAPAPAVVVAAQPQAETAPQLPPPDAITAVETAARALERPRSPVALPVGEADPVLETPDVPPLPAAPVTEVVTGAARAAGGGAQPLPVPGSLPVTVPPAP